MGCAGELSEQLAKDQIAAIPVFFDPRMVADSESFSPSAGKPAKVVESWSRLGLPLDVRPVRPVTTEDFCLAHAPEMVREIRACRRENGFGNTLETIANSLPYTSGAMLEAAREAMAQTGEDRDQPRSILGQRASPMPHLRGLMAAKDALRNQEREVQDGCASDE